MNALLFLLVLDLALVAGAILLLFLVIIRKGPIVQNLALATLLIVLAAGVWYTSIRTPPTLP